MNSDQIMGATKDAAGNVVHVGNIDASGSGVIGSTVKLQASGGITGLVFARENIDLTASQSVNVTALAQGIGKSLGMRFLPGEYAVNEPFPHTDNFGLELWVRPDATDGSRCVAYNGATDGNGWGFFLINGRYQVLLGNRLLCVGW